MILTISLVNCGLEDSALEPLFASTWSKTITKLSLDNNPNLTFRAWKSLFDGTLTSMTHLSLCGNQITDDILKQVSPSLTNNKSLKRLDLWHNRITDEGAAYLSEALLLNSSLESLLLSDNRITDVGAAELALCFTKRKPEVKEMPTLNEVDESSKDRDTVVSASGRLSIGYFV